MFKIVANDMPWENRNLFRIRDPSQEKVCPEHKVWAFSKKMWRNKGPKMFEWRSSEVSPSLNVYSKFELSLSMSGTCAYQIEQLCAHTSD